jgi:hypothetical protein
MAATKSELKIRKVTVGRVLIIIGFPLSLGIVRSLSSFAGSPTELSRFSPLICPFQFFTGMDCPTCGLTRSTLCAWNGDFSQAFEYHFLGPILFVIATLTWFLFIVGRQALLLHLLNRIKTLKASPSLLKITLLAYIVWGFFLRSPSL